MEADALERLKAIYDIALGMPVGSGTEPEAILKSANGGWGPSDIRRLSKVATLAAETGDLLAPVAAAAARLAMRTREGLFDTLEADSQWAGALRWAIEDLSHHAWCAIAPGSTSREREVGAAVVRLRRKGYPITVDGQGCIMVEQRRLELLRRIDGLVRQLGGVEVLMQLFRILGDEGRLEGDMWLLGDVLPPVGQRKNLTLSYGWLYALGLKHVRPTKTLRQPKVAWDNLVSLSRDYAAIIDVERYNNMERSNVRPGDLVQVLYEALGWHQLFTFPRYASSVVLELVDAMDVVLVDAQWKALGVSYSELVRELKTLFRTLRSDRPTLISKADGDRHLPRLVRLAAAPPGRVNPSFIDPFGSGKKTSEGTILFEYGLQYLLLPTSVAAAQAATMLVTLIWKTFSANEARTAVGAICERLVAAICSRSLCSDIKTDISYDVGRQTFQIDALAQEGEDITLVEVKAKSLTASALSGDLPQYLLDYDTSYLAMLKQLVRHEAHMRKGNKALPKVVGRKTVSKVAVSPLTYGPLSDASLGRSVLLALFSAKLGLQTSMRGPQRSWQTSRNMCSASVRTWTI